MLQDASQLPVSCTSDVTSTPQKLTLTHNIVDFDQTRGNTISMTLTNLLHLPTSTKPTSEFKLTSLSVINGNEHPIDQAEVYTLAATQPATLQVFSATRTVFQTNLETQVDFKFTPLHTIPENGQILLVIPTDQFLYVDDDASNARILYNSQEITPAIDSETATAVTLKFTIPCTGTCVKDTPVEFSVTTIRNTATAAVPENSIQLTTLTPDNFLIDSVTNNFFATPAISLGKLSELSMSYSSPIVGDLNTITVSAKLENALPDTGFIVVQPPTDLLFKHSTEELKCLIASQEAICTAKYKTSQYGEYVSEVQAAVNLVCSPCEADAVLELEITNVVNYFTTEKSTSAIRVNTMNNSLAIDNGIVEASDISRARA